MNIILNTILFIAVICLFGFAGCVNHAEFEKNKELFFKKIKSILNIKNIEINTAENVCYFNRRLDIHCFGLKGYYITSVYFDSRVSHEFSSNFVIFKIENNSWFDCCNTLYDVETFIDEESFFKRLKKIKDL